MRGCIGAIDIGASKVRAALFKGRILVTRISKPFPSQGGPEAPANAAVGLLESLLERTPCSLEAIGVASIGPLDPVRGVVEETPNAPIRNFPIREPIEDSFGVPVYVANDCNAGAWAEYTLGRGRGFRSLAYVAVGTGIGGGVVLSGKLLVGPRGLGAEVGHIVVDMDSTSRCGCGGQGHWEGIASGSALPRTAHLLAEVWRGPETPAYEEALRELLSPERLYDYARRGDSFALKVVDFIARAHAAGIASIAVAYDTEAVFLGGGALLGGWDLLAPRIIASLGEYLLPQARPRIERCSFGVDQQLHGAAALALNPPEVL